MKKPRSYEDAQKNAVNIKALYDKTLKCWVAYALNRPGLKASGATEYEAIARLINLDMQRKRNPGEPPADEILH